VSTAEFGLKYKTSPNRSPSSDGRPSASRPIEIVPRFTFAPRRADSETPMELMVWIRIVANDPSFRTVRDADLSDGLTLRVLRFTTFPDLSKTVNMTDVAPVAPAFGENLIRPVNEFPLRATVRDVSFGVEVGNPTAENPFTPAGAVSESISNESGDEVDELFPAASEIVAITNHVPLLSVGKSHDEVIPTTYVQVLVSVPLVAVIVTESPLVPPTAETPGVVSEVLLSESDAPVSELAIKSTPPGAVGAEVSIFSDRVPVAGPVLPAGSVIDAETVHVPSPSVGRVQLLVAPTV